MENQVLNVDCIEYMKSMDNKSVDFVLTDIPYDEVERQTNGLLKIKNLDDLGDADKLQFDLDKFLDEVYRVSKNSICIFCGFKQFSYIYDYFSNKAGTVRALVYEKTNPVPSTDSMYI